MLRSLNYTDSVADLGKLGRHFLRKEWSLFFDQIAKSFTGKCSGFDAITSITCQIGYSLLTNKVIDIASLLLQQMGQKMKHVETGRTKIYYHMFLMMLLLHFAPKLTTQVADKTIKECYRQHTRIFNDLNIEVVKMAAKLQKDGKPFPTMVFP